MDEAEAALYCELPKVQSDFDGPMHGDFALWGYSEGGSRADQQCEDDLAGLKDMSSAMQELKNRPAVLQRQRSQSLPQRPPSRGT